MGYPDQVIICQIRDGQWVSTGMLTVVVADRASVESCDGGLGCPPCALGEALHLGRALSAALGLGLL